MLRGQGECPSYCPRAEQERPQGLATSEGVLLKQLDVLNNVNTVCPTLNERVADSSPVL